MNKVERILIFALLLFFTGVHSGLHAEGTKQLEPAAGDFTKVRINKALTYNNFANYNSTVSERLYVRVGSTTEKICFGFGDWGAGNMNLKIRDPNDFLVFGPYGLSNIPGDPGVISTYAQAVAGPDIVDPAGYEAVIFNPATTGDFYFEFDFSGNNYRDFQYFDITVVDAFNQPIDGRVWSMAWQLSAGDYLTEPGSNVTMFVYSTDSIVSSLYFNGLRAEGMEMYANRFGCQLPPVPFPVSRLSGPGRLEAPEFKVFINDPDPVQFPSGQLGQIIPGTLQVTHDCAGNILMNFVVTKPGAVEILININPLPGIQPEDILIYDTLVAGTNILTWDGFNGLGQKVPYGSPFTVQVTYLMGPFNFLIYDGLENANGYVTTVVRPLGQVARVSWCDSLLPGGTCNINGCYSSPPSSGCHTWTGTPTSGTGNDNTINTWWYITNLSSANAVAIYGYDTVFEYNPTACAGDTVYLEGIPFTQTGNYLFPHTSVLTGCDSSILYHLVFNPVPGVSLGPDMTICSGQTYSFDAGAGPGYTYTWDDITHGIYGISNQQVYTTGNPAKYRATVYNTFGCYSSDTAELFVSPSPVVTFAYCFDNPTQIGARPVRLRGGIPLGGTFNGPGVSNGYFDPSIAGPGTHVINYTYANIYGCANQATLPVVVLGSAGTFICGSTLTDIRDNKQYPTVQIGGQCWMAANLNYGTQIPSASVQRDNCIPEKYCYQDISGSCSGNGGLYQWDEIMNYEDAARGHGLCPPGWHVPDEADWNALFAVYVHPAFAGAPLKSTGFSGFNADFPGQRFLNRTWSFAAFAGHWWSSTAHGTYKAWSHAMNIYDPSVAWYPGARSNAFQVRCLKD